jgi:hypothetical protein
MDNDNAISIVKQVSNRRLKSIRNSLPVTIMCMKLLTLKNSAMGYGEVTEVDFLIKKNGFLPITPG